MEKSAFRTTLAQGPGQSVGGVKENAWREKSAKTKFVNSGTTQGVVAGRVTGGSAVAVLADPICNPGGGIVCARLAQALATITRARSVLAVGKINFDGVNCNGRAGENTAFINASKTRPKSKGQRARGQTGAQHDLRR